MHNEKIKLRAENGQLIDAVVLSKRPESIEVVIGEGIALALPAGMSVAAGREVIVGVRPEHLSVSADGVPAEVVVVEPTGADTQIFCKLAGNEISAVVRERHQFRPGLAIRLTPQLTYLFDPASGARLA